MVVPPTAANQASSQIAACNDMWIFLLQSGVKLRFDGASQELSQIEVYLVSKENNPLTKHVKWALKGQNLAGANLTLEGIEQVMY